MTTLAEKIENLGYVVGADLKAILHELADLAVGAAPVAEAIETAVAPEDVAATEAAATVAEAVSVATTKKTAAATTAPTS
jgi:phage-related protein